MSIASLSAAHRRIHDDIFQELAEEPGFLRAIDTFPQQPAFHGVSYESGYPIQTLTVWRDLDSVSHFVYKARAHRRAMRELPDLYIKMPNGRAVYDVLWWFDEDMSDGADSLLVEEAYRRMDYLLHEGPSAYAFNLKHPYDENGQLTDFRALRDQHW